ncbi:uncharacterized protein YndB with AHSA1/START domain [Amycolatopsis bartoniae]|uniref:Activator of Hsp90 ATPase homologue 1/2-like C-terminal domain-containing protein n=1 Tax=Amycolatopsis bartoniae TaxID=941986 RepID=A0A8H9J1C3_9PSEU|nr:SRPBCC family protein [Amycolatopsis bartoniae]MBB2935969.1 uncharacterized protein YndB with AHSA1/START domain [Amycolatopsis bartoniae]TVT00455.1 SRPBCC family protein [Amycolatopsis bartoniae]GHF63161.1 hypothetical protein GCM10017566_40970 [Amycolatopsis bartoniae]
MDVAEQINAVSRKVGDRSVVLRRGFVAEIEDLWGALTDPERLGQWFLPVSGDLELGGRYQLEGNASGEVLSCRRPELLRVSWEYGQAPPSVVEVRLRGVKGGTFLEVEHSGLDDEAQWDQFGPGAVGVGWDLTLLGLGLHVAGLSNPAGWTESDEAREYFVASSEAWAAAHEAAGEDPEQAAAAAERTAAAYAQVR